MKPKIKTLKITEQLIGKTLPPTYGGASGRGLELLMISLGIPLQNGSGADWKLFGLEVKSRDLKATSPQTIGSILPENMILSDWPNSSVAEKFQQQFRVHTRDNIIVEARVYDFSPKFIQEKLSKAWDILKDCVELELIAQANDPTHELPLYIPGTRYGYLERKENIRSYHFRVSSEAMKELEGMALSTINILFELS
jgi:hypothetical protein